VLNDHLTSTQQAAPQKTTTLRVACERTASDRASAARVFDQYAAQGAD
jgi:hypothetical protein